jgi:ribosome maturation factor RimP
MQDPKDDIEELEELIEMDADGEAEMRTDGVVEELADETTNARADEASDVVSEEGSGKDSWRLKVMKMATEVAAREGCEIYDFDFIGAGQNRALRVFIDKIGPGGVAIEDCSNVSKGLNLMLDVDDVIPGGAYNLEVSSPGLERPLRTAPHFEKAVGLRVFVRTFAPFAELDTALDESSSLKLGRAKQLEGKIAGVDGIGSTDPVLMFDAENGGNVIRVRVPLSKITKANTVFIFESNEKPTGGKKKK